METTHSFDELLGIEADGLTFAGYLYDDRTLIPVLLRSQHSQVERRRRILRLNGRAEHVPEQLQGELRADPEQLQLWES